MRVWKAILIVFAACVVAAVVVGTIAIIEPKIESEKQQASIQPFYDLPSPLPPGKPGEVIRSEPITGFELKGATVSRILYYSTAPDGKQQVSSGMVFTPTKKSTAPRPVVAYAHGTSGLGDACTPSRNPDILSTMPFIQEMMNLGWVVAATDYVGLGVVGNPYYLIGQSEAADVVNSVRAARSLPGSNAGSRYAVMGHSQGGHSAVWTGELSEKIAPELDLLGVTVTEPALQLKPLLSEQWDSTIAWALGPDVLVSWPNVYPDLNPNDVLTEHGQGVYRELAYECLLDAGLSGAIQSKLGYQLFSKNPLEAPGWTKALEEQTPKPLPASMPFMLTQAIPDGVVLANTNALTYKTWCEAGSTLQMNWLGQLATGSLAPETTHEDALMAGWPLETTWIQERFDGRPPPSNCGLVPPVKAAS